MDVGEHSPKVGVVQVLPQTNWQDDHFEAIDYNGAAKVLNEICQCLAHFGLSVAGIVLQTKNGVFRGQLSSSTDEGEQENKTYVFVFPIRSHQVPTLNNVCTATRTQLIARMARRFLYSCYTAKSGRQRDDLQTARRINRAGTPLAI